jgi:voltage-gated potassium channel
MAEDRQESRLLARLLRVQLFPRRGSGRRVRLLVRHEEATAARTLLVRVAIVLGLFLSVVAVLWLDRGGLRDASDGVVSFLDVVDFTMVTVTTVGYGDIVPVHPFARSLAMFEALVGQIFPAILLAGLVSMQISDRQRRRGDGESR